MANFDEALRFVLRNEDPHFSGVVTEDSGGRTRFGVAERFHPELGNEFYLASLEDALATAQEIYHREYWNGIRGEEIRDQSIATKLLDMAVNMGVRQATVLCQRALNGVGAHQVVEDGIMGELSLHALNACAADALLESLRDVCSAFYQHVAVVRPEAQQYLRGWLSRARA